MIALQRQSVRSSLRLLTLLAALTSLLLAMWTPYVGVAQANDHTNTCDKAFPGLEKIDDDAGTFTTLEGVVLVWGGFDDSPVDGVVYTVPEGYTLDLCVKGGDGTDTPAFYPDLTGDGTVTTNHGAVSHIAYLVTQVETGSGTVAKAWAGDSFDATGVTVTFTADINGGESFTMAPGDTETLQLGDTLTITDETVTGLPATCDYASNLPASGLSFTATEADPDGTITITNTVDCDQPDGPTVDVAFTKVWQGDDEGNAVAAIQLHDGDSLVGTVTDGGTLDITDEQGTSLAVTEVLTTALPTNCTVTSTTWTLDGEPFTSPWAVPGSHEVDTTYTIVATNTVTCSSTPPPPTVTGSGSAAKAWQGDAIDLDAVSVTFTADVDGGTSFTMEPGDSQSLQLGQTLTITDETVTGLPATCDHVSDLPADGASFTATSTTPDGTITVTNTVTCEDQEAVVGSGTVVKDWTGAEIDVTGVTVSFTATIDDGTPFTLEPGDVEPLDVGQVLTVTDESVTGLPATCDYVSDLPASGLSFTATEATPDGTLTVTNDVACTDVSPEEVVNVRLEKVWDVTDPAEAFDPTTIDVTFALDGYDGTYEPGDVVVATPGDVLVVDETMGSDLPARCELTDVLADPYTVTDATGQVLTVTNVVECAEVLGVVVTRPATLPRTGLGTGPWALFAALLSGAGALLLLATRKESTGRRS